MNSYQSVVHVRNLQISQMSPFDPIWKVICATRSKFLMENYRLSMSKILRMYLKVSPILIFGTIIVMMQIRRKEFRLLRIVKSVFIHCALLFHLLSFAQLSIQSYVPVKRHTNARIIVSGIVFYTLIHLILTTISREGLNLPFFTKNVNCHIIDPK